MLFFRVAKTFCFSNNGHALYFCSPTEVQKITLSADICESLNEMLGELFLPHETPEPPKQSFFNNLFGGGAKTVDREELFGQSCGKPSPGVAKYSAGTAGMAQAQERAGVATSAIGMAKQAAIERGEKLASVEDATERMREQAELYQQNAHQLMLKYRDKKWYQFWGLCLNPSDTHTHIHTHIYIAYIQTLPWCATLRRLLFVLSVQWWWYLPFCLAGVRWLYIRQDVMLRFEVECIAEPT